MATKSCGRNVCVVSCRLPAAILIGFLLAPAVLGEIVITPAEGMPKSVTIKRGAASVYFRGGWNSFGVRTRSGKGSVLLSPVLCGLTGADGKNIWWTYVDGGWPRLKWVAVEQGKDRDVLYVEGEWKGWRAQAWIAMYGEEEAIYIRKRTTRMRGTSALPNERGVMAVSHKPGPFEEGGVTVVVDGKRNPLHGANADQYILFENGVSAAAVNPGYEFQKRGKVKSFASFLYNPKKHFLEVSFSQAQGPMKEGDYLETTMVLLWGDGDISDRVQAVLKEAGKHAARLPAAERPADVEEKTERASAVPWIDGLPPATLRASLFTPKGKSRRVHAVGAPLAQAPTIDGKLDDAAWRGRWAGQFIIYNTRNLLSDTATSFQIAHDARALYLAVRCPQQNMAEVRKAKPTPEKYAGGVQVEIFFHVGKSVYQICIGPEGGYYDERDGNVAFDLKPKIAARQNAEGWSLEAEIPFKSFGMTMPKTFETWGFNIVRHTYLPNKLWEYSAWNPAKGTFASTSNFGTIFFGTEEQYRAENRFFLEAMLDRDVYDTLDAGAGVWLNIIATAGLPEGTELAEGIADKAGKLLRVSRQSVTGTRADLVLNLKGLRPGEYQLKLGLAVAGKQVAKTEVPLRIRKATHSVKGSGKVGITVRSAYASALLPVTMGVPFPKGELTDPSRVRLLDAQGREVPLQTSTLAAWDPAGSISWLRLEFQTPVAADKTAGFTLEYGVSPKAQLKPGTPAESILVTESAESFVVNTGPLQFTVPRGHGGVLESALLYTNGNGKFEKDEQLLTPGGLGPYLVDGEGKVYQAALDKDATVQMEEAGPLRAVFRIESWYRSEEGSKLCKHVTRLTAYAGLPHLRLEHTWIMTAATGEAVFKDIGFALPTTQNRLVAFGTDDGGFFTDQSTFPRHLVQYADTQYEIRGEYRLEELSDAAERNKRRWTAFAHGARAPGWMAVKGPRAGMVLAVDEFWQNFPKELGLDNGRVTFHIWPRHGRPRNRPVADPTLNMLDFVHGGEALDFTLPEEIANHKPANKHEQGFINDAKVANAIGIAKTHRFALTFFPASETIPDVQEATRAVADTPRALAAPEWMTASGVFGPIHPYDPKNFPEIEEALELAGKIIPRLNRLSGCYGMWIYGQLHTDYNFYAHYWDIYRHFNQLHHNGPLWPWVMWVRSGDPDYFDFALANTRIVADVGFCHHSRPEFEGLPHPRGKIRGALTDYKGLTPWNSGSRSPDYNSLTSFLMWHYYMTGDGWTRDVAMEWGERAKLQGPVGGYREAAGTVRATLQLYRASWDAGLIPLYRRTAEALLRTQLDYGGFPSWENYTPWLGEYQEFTGQENARRALLKWADAFAEGHGDITSKSAGSGYGTHLNIPAEAYFASGDIRYARQARGLLECWMWGVHSNPDSYLRGTYPGRYAREMSFFGNLLVRGPMALHAWARAGKDISPIYPPSVYKAQKDKGGAYRMTLFLLDENDRPTDINLGGTVSGTEPEKKYRMELQVLAPDGVLVKDTEIAVSQRALRAHGSARVYARPWTRFQLAADGKKGVYRLLLTSSETPFSLRLPVSNWKEAYPLEKPGQFMLFESLATMGSFYLPEGLKDPRVKLTLLHAGAPATFHLWSPTLEKVKRIHLLSMSSVSRSRVVRVPVPKDYEGGFWTLVGGIAPYAKVEFAGDWQPKYFSPRPDRAFNPEAYGVAGE